MQHLHRHYTIGGYIPFAGISVSGFTIVLLAEWPLTRRIAKQHTKTGERIHGHVARSDDIKVRSSASQRPRAFYSIVFLRMASTTPSSGLEAILELIQRNKVRLYLFSMRNPGFVDDVMIRLDRNQEGRSLIGRTVLQRFDWQAEGRACPTAGDSILISIHHPEWGLRVTVQFYVESDPNLGVIVGEPAYSTMLATWTAENLLTQVLQRLNGQLGMVSFPHVLYDLLTSVQNLPAERTSITVP